MNDERFLKDWLQDTSDTDSETQAAADKVMAVVPENGQRSRWWPLLPGRRRSYRDPSPNPQGRTSLMLSPVKLITGVALTFAIGGMFLVVQPVPEPAEHTNDAELADGSPIEVTSELRHGGCKDGVSEWGGPVLRIRGSACTPLAEWSDPRLNGTFTNMTNSDSYTQNGLLDIQLYAWSIENEHGAWRERPRIAVGFGEISVGKQGHPHVSIMDGEGDYDGLTAVLIVNEDFNVGPRGYIIEGDIPPAPENASTK
jgi:hypothetical protein